MDALVFFALTAAVGEAEAGQAEGALAAARLLKGQGVGARARVRSQR